MPKLTVKKIELLIKRKEFGRHPDGNQLYLNIREPDSPSSQIRCGGETTYTDCCRP